MNFLCFEGIDGSGKTTLSEMVRKQLLENGYKVIHLREGKELVSPVANTIREMAKDPANMALEHWPEFFLYLAREKQAFDEKVKGLPQDNELFVIADRSLFSPLVMAKDIRGIQSKLLEPLIDELWEGSEPAVVFFCDVDLDVSQTRKKIGKFSEPSGKVNSRKGLWGLCFREKMREGYLRLENERNNWVRIDNNGPNTDFAFAKIWNTLEDKFGVQSPKKYQIAKPKHSLQGCIALENMEQASEEFASIVKESNPYLQGYLLHNLYKEPWITQIKSLAESHPEAALFSLRGNAPQDLKEPIVQDLWKHSSLRRQWVKALVGEEITWEKPLLEKAFEFEPKEVLFALKHCLSDWAYEIRESAWKEHAAVVLQTLSGLNDAKAWALRDRVLGSKSKKKWANSLLLGLSGVDQVDAWNIRERLYETNRWSTILSLKGCAQDQANTIRLENIKQAPKLVVKSLQGLEDDVSWSLRKQGLGAWPEVLESIKHLEHSEADALRDFFWQKAPHLVLDSLGQSYYRTEMLDNSWVQKVLKEKPNGLLLYKSILAKEDRRVFNLERIQRDKLWKN